ncbi:hypothetical protein [Alkalicoccus luteus]|uniref:hypothetical protein n=1 Tax=Alkalicoccus luteus TaxID=1237094 RepID=UPI0040346B5F
MKKLTAMFAALGLTAACSADNPDTESYSPDDYQIAFPSTDGSETEIFTDNRADLYYYFTGVN